MSSRINVCSATVLDNPARLEQPIKLEIIFEAFEDINEEIDWEMVFVATDGRVERDQSLDIVSLESVRNGPHKFIFEAPSPDKDKLNAEDLMDVTLLQLRVKYREQEFARISWFVVHRYTDEALLAEPPSTPIVDKMQRTILTDDVRVTTYAIKWDDEQPAAETEAEVEAEEIAEEEEEESQAESSKAAESLEPEAPTTGVEKQQGPVGAVNVTELKESTATTPSTEPFVDMTNSNQ